MKSASQSFQPRVITLESRCQPGSILFRGLDTSLLAGTIVPLDLQDQVQDQRTPALVAPQSQGITANPGDVLIAPVQGLGSVNLSNPIQTIQDTHSIVPDPITQLQALPSFANPVPIEGSGKIHSAGTGCGEAVVNGDFSSGFSSWSVNVAGDPYLVTNNPGVVFGSELQAGSVGFMNTISQSVPTPTCYYYTISFDALHDNAGGGASVLQVEWNHGIVASIYGDTGFGVTHFSADIYTPESTSALRIIEREDPGYWYISNVSAYA
jgi:hypothetical protein